MVAEQYHKKSSLGIGNGIFRGIVQLGISGLSLGNILVNVVRKQLL